ncbi:hypothetical protein RND81_04G079300 [Saponaria officinalis]|uniref:MULE transposase domain-containing protein n=1 Tax=Saponaria officinalis TaxID=3572 RepID=A0AAW1LJ63_SAPOF
MSDPESLDSFENFGGDEVDYNPLFATKQRFSTRGKAFEWAQNIAFENGFALVIANSGHKNRSQPELVASYFRCSRYGSSKVVYDPEKPKKKPKTVKCQCTFCIRAVENYHFEDKKQLVLWNIVTANGFGCHNHHPTKYKDGHRHYAGLNEEKKAYVRQKYRASILPRDIKSALKLSNLHRDKKYSKRNEKGEEHRTTNVHWHEINPDTHELTLVFMSLPEAVKLFRAYPHNTYNMALVEVVGVTPAGSSFLIACVLIPSESEEGYTWLLRKLMDILECTGASPSVFVTDWELGLVRALHTLFPETPHLLCRWHVNRAIESRAVMIHKIVFYKDRVLNNPETRWWNVIDATCEDDFNKAWSVFSQKWKRLASYISRTWGEHAKKFVLCYTNEYFHLGNTATSRVESAHSLLKAWLKGAHLTLDTMWSQIHSMLEGRHSKIRKELQDSLSRPRITQRLFSLLQGKVSTKVLEIMEDELKRGVAFDGHYGFRVLSHALRGGEEDYIQMRDWYLKEITGSDVYKGLFEVGVVTKNGLSKYENTLRRIRFIHRTACGEYHWMSSDDLFVFASLFNWTICVIGENRYTKGPKEWQCMTILPLKSANEGVPPMVYFGL